MTKKKKKFDTAGVVAPPPLIALAAVAAGLILDQLAPIGVVGALIPRTPRFILCGILLLTGAYIVITAARTFRSAGTEVAPWRPSTALVTTGLFAKSRNPMYVSFAIILFGLALGLGSDWTFLCGVIAALVLHVGVVRREERYLLRKFGQRYQDYMDRVPRYGWPF